MIDRIDTIETIETAVAGSSGAVLHCSHTAIDPGKPALLIALPFGVPATVAQAAFSAFAPGFNVVTWESRFILNLDQDFTGDERLAPAIRTDGASTAASLLLDAVRQAV